MLWSRGERGETHADGVCGRHHLAFAAYQRSDRQSWGRLRGLSRYDLAPGAERPPVFHAGLEIVTVLLAGRWHRTGDLSSATPLGANDAELVSAGAGVALGGRAASGGSVSLVEIRLASQKPDREAWRQWLARRRTDLGRPIATGAPPQPDALMWASAARLHYGWLESGDHFRSALENAELGFLLIVDGAVSVNGTIAQAGDGVAATGSGRLQVEALERARLIWLLGL